MNIVGLILWDVNFMLGELREQVIDNQLKNLRISSNREILDVKEYQNYLETTEITNFYRLKDILLKVEEIITLHNEKFKVLEDESYQKPMVNEYYIIEDNHCYPFKKSGQTLEEFIDNKQFDYYGSKQIATKCAQLLNVITAAYPELFKELTSPCITSFDKLNRPKESSIIQNTVPLDDTEFFKGQIERRLGFFDPWGIGINIFYEVSKEGYKIEYYSPVEYLKKYFNYHLLEIDKSRDRAANYHCICQVNDKIREEINKIYYMVRGGFPYLPDMAEAAKAGEKYLRERIHEKYQLDLFLQMVKSKVEIIKASKDLLIIDKSKGSLNKKFPTLPECFIEESFFKKLLINPKIKELYSIQEDGIYQWKIRKKNYLAGLAHRLYNLGKLDKKVIKSNQDLARVFCPYFNVEYNTLEEKQFQPDRAKVEYFEFIR